MFRSNFLLPLFGVLLSACTLTFRPQQTQTPVTPAQSALAEFDRDQALREEAQVRQVLHQTPEQPLELLPQPGIVLGAATSQPKLPDSEIPPAPEQPPQTPVDTPPAPASPPVTMTEASPPTLKVLTGVELQICQDTCNVTAAECKFAGMAEVKAFNACIQKQEVCLATCEGKEIPKPQQKKATRAKSANRRK